MEDRQVANFFWHGDLTIYEVACINSFVKNNFVVNLWSFNNFNLPSVNFCNIEQFYKLSDIQKFSQDGKQGSLAVFSDAVRYHILKKFGGWWFDTDCFCFRDQSDFFQLTQDKKIVAGWEDSTNINGAVLNFVDSELAGKAFDLFTEISTEKNNSFKWGDIGPKLITQLIKENNLESNVQPYNYFYPIHYKNTLDMFDESKFVETSTSCKNSYILHLWNEILRKKKIDKNIIPNNKSLINHLLKK